MVLVLRECAINTYRSDFFEVECERLRFFFLQTATTYTVHRGPHSPYCFVSGGRKLKYGGRRPCRALKLWWQRWWLLGEKVGANIEYAQGRTDVFQSLALEITKHVVHLGRAEEKSQARGRKRKRVRILAGGRFKNYRGWKKMNYRVMTQEWLVVPWEYFGEHGWVLRRVLQVGRTRLRGNGGGVERVHRVLVAAAEIFHPRQRVT